MKQENKDKAAGFWGEIKAGLKTGFDATKKGLRQAGNAIQNYSDLSVVAIEKKQFESKYKKVCAELGEIVAEKLSSKNASVSASDGDLVPLLKDIASFSKEISRREKIIKAAEKGGAKTEENKSPARKSAPKKPAAKKAASKAVAEKSDAPGKGSAVKKNAPVKKEPVRKPSAKKAAEK